MPIRILPSSLTNKIAAGEVIERPASVVKELVENSLDAGAGRIEVELEEAGAKLIRVVDDGCGMDEDDMALVFAGHATSKLAEEEDLYSVSTMGFRGEALASIGAVSDARIVSRTAESDAGHEVRMEAGTISPVKACGAPVGTQVEVRNLFHNVPVRKKFLKTTATEMAHVTEAVTRLALVRPDVHFVLKHNGRRVYNLPPAEDRAQRIGEFFGREIAENIIPLRWRSEQMEVEGYLLPPSVDRRNTKMQYTYVNGRYVRNPTLLHAIRQAYERLMTSGRRPVCFLFLNMDPHSVDVNVHPTKLEVKFRKPQQVHSQVVAAMRECLREARITPQVALERDGQTAERQESVRRAIGDFFAGRRETEGPQSLPARNVPESGGRLPRGRAGSGGFTEPPETPPRLRPRAGGCMQVLDSFIVEETEDGINLIDQHALHERILYNRIRRRLEQSGLDSQQLLVPELVELPRQEFYAVAALEEQLGRFGMDIEEFGEQTIIVRSFPQVLGKFDGEAFFRDLLDELEGPEGAQKVDGRVEKIVRMMACKGAVKAGQRLSPEQMREILRARAEEGACGTCPHGRPTTIELTRSELNRQFRRT
ncbi:MAG: DNA mismatch repair endonuclease MutL [Planctomycetota bacterium]